MQKTYVYPEYPYVQSDAQRQGQVLRHPVVIVGAGPIGLSAALDCAARGLRVLLLDDNNSVSIGSRAVCYAKRTLEVWQRLGVAAPAVAKGVRWQVGKVFFKDELAYQFDLLPEAGHQMPAMINLQQYHLEEQLVAACQREPLIELAWKHRVVALDRPDNAPVTLTVETPDGRFALQADWLIACDGASSDIRGMVGARFTGQAFQDRFLIADVVMQAPPQAATEGAAAMRSLSGEPQRWFWFDPPFHPGQSVLLHKQCDDVWRIDFQLGWDADPAVEIQPERVTARIQAMLGPEQPFELEWVSIYQFACRRIDQFRHGRVIFAGDSAHQVSPFGARGANTGVQDVDNLGWKLAAVLQGQAPEALLDSYHFERAQAADDNIAHSTRATDFITPKSAPSMALRNAVLKLARTEAFARPLVNSGRLSTPTPYQGSPLSTPDEDGFAGLMGPGAPCADAPVLREGQPDWLLEQLGRGFVLLSFGPEAGAADLVTVGQGAAAVSARVLQVGRDIVDEECLLTQRYDGQPGTVYLIRPDQFVAARWRRFDADKVAAALRRALGWGNVPQTLAPAPAANTVPELQRQPNIPDADGFYAELIAAQRELSEEQAQRFSAQLLLILANQVGDRSLLSQAMQLARQQAMD